MRRRADADGAFTAEGVELELMCLEKTDGVDLAGDWQTAGGDGGQFRAIRQALDATFPTRFAFQRRQFREVLQVTQILRSRSSGRILKVVAEAR